MFMLAHRAEFTELSEPGSPVKVVADDGTMVFGRSGDLVRGQFGQSKEAAAAQPELLGRELEVREVTEDYPDD